MRQTQVKPSFVEFIPDRLDDGVLYISERFRTCSHNCCCGCGEEVVLPLSPAEWQLSRDGDAVSLWPSVGNWDYACKSHYVIRWNQVRWSGPMNARQIKRVKQRDQAALLALVGSTNAARDRERSADSQKMAARPVPAVVEPQGCACVAGKTRKRTSVKHLLQALFRGRGDT